MESEAQSCVSVSELRDFTQSRGGRSSVDPPRSQCLPFSPLLSALFSLIILEVRCAISIEIINNIPKKIHHNYNGWIHFDCGNWVDYAIEEITENYRMSLHLLVMCN